jgi:hypothetical protein
VRREWRRIGAHRVVRILSWVEAVVLVAYGGLLTVVGLLVQADVVHAAATADRRALAWHTYLWDPWFLIWGLLVVVALWLSTRAPGGPPARSEPSRSLVRENGELLDVRVVGVQPELR